MRVTDRRTLKTPVPNDLPCPAPHGKPRGGVRVGCAMMILVRIDCPAIARPKPGVSPAYAIERMSPQGHQPRQPVRRGSQHPKFTELVIYNSASFPSDSPLRLCTALRSSLKFHVSVIVTLYHKPQDLSINLWFIFFVTPYAFPASRCRPRSRTAQRSPDTAHSPALSGRRRCTTDPCSRRPRHRRGRWRGRRAGLPAFR